MEKLYPEESLGSRQRPIQFTQDEIDIINDIRTLDYGKIVIFIQDGVMISKEISRTVKTSRNNKNNKGNIQSKNNYSNGNNNDFGSTY